MSQPVEFPLDGGGSVLVEVVPGDGITRAGRGGGVSLAGQSLQKALDPIQPIADCVLEKLRGLVESPDRVSVEFGVKLSAESNVIVARGTAEANFVVRLEWSRPTGTGGLTATGDW